MKTIRLSLLAILAFFCTTLISCNDDAGGDMDADIVGPDWDDLEEEDDDAPLEFTKFMYKCNNKWAEATIDTVNRQILMPGVTNGLDITDVAYTLASSSIKISPEPSDRIGGWGPEEVFQIYRGADILSYTAVLEDWITNDVDYIGFESFSYKVNDEWIEVDTADLKFTEIEIANIISSTDITDVAYSLTPASATISPTPESFNGGWSALTTFKVSLLETSAEVTINLVDYKYGALTDDGKVLQSALLTLQSYMNNDNSVSATDVDIASAIITAYGSLMAEDQGLLELAFETIDIYETTYDGALFINSLTSAANSKLSRTATGMNIHFAQVALQQVMIDDVYTSENLRRFSEVFSANKFNTSDYFPGAIESADSTVTYTRKIEARNRVSWGSPYMAETKDAERPTGCYAAPGDIVTVTVPESFVGIGAEVCVGSHTWDNSVKPTMKRLDRITIEYEITSTETLVSNPLGGCIMIHVPYGYGTGTDSDIIDIEIKNAHRHPYYSDKYNVASWEEEREHPGIWTFWESDRMMINMPTKWCYSASAERVKASMDEWDEGMDAINQFRGWYGVDHLGVQHDPADRDKTTLYLQCDLQMRGSAYYPGYPQTNDIYNPTTSETGDKDYYYLNGIQDSYAACLHELGHATMITKFRGETEAFVNFLYIVAMNQKFGWDLDKAYDLSFTYGTGINATLDGYATTWMVKDNFRNQGEMNYSNVPGDEMKYQHRGWGKYVEFANLFGWDKLGGIFELYEKDYSGPKNFYPASFNNDPVDNRILQFSLAAGYDCRPLIHFWGVMPEDPTTLAQWHKDNGVSTESDIIYDRLEYYKTQNIIPADNAAFNTFQKQYCSSAKYDESTETNGDGWYYNWSLWWTDEHCKQAQDYIQAIQDMYFPNGDPDSSTEWTNDGSSTSSRHSSCGAYTCTSSSPWKRAD